MEGKKKGIRFKHNHITLVIYIMKMKIQRVISRNDCFYSEDIHASMWFKLFIFMAVRMGKQSLTCRITDKRQQHSSK